MKDFAPNCPLYVQILKPENKFHVKFAGESEASVVWIVFPAITDVSSGVSILEESISWCQDNFCLLEDILGLSAPLS